jgi:hypothetical protein
VNSFYEDATAQGWLTQAFGVLTMDDLWTRQLETEHMSPDEMRETADFGEALVDAWLRLTDGGALKPIEQYMRVYSYRAVETARQVGATYMPSDPVDMQKAAVKAFSTLVSAREREAGQLRSKIESLRSATWTPGDLSPTSRCLIIFGCAVTAFALGQPLIGGLFGTWFTTAGCPKLTIGIIEGGG